MSRSNKARTTTRANQAKPTVTVVITNPEKSPAQQAFELMLPVAQAIPVEQLSQALLSIFEATVLIDSKLDQIDSLRNRFIAELKNPPLFELDSMPQLIRAARHADLLARSTTEQSSQTNEMYDEVILPNRKILQATLDLMVATKKLPTSALQGSASGLSHVEEAQMVLTIVVLLRNNWDQVQSSCPYSLQSLIELESKVERFLEELSARNGRIKDPTHAEMKKRMLTLLITYWDNIRKAVQYVRFNEGDAEQWAPSLFSTRKSGRRQQQNKATTESTTPTITANDNPMNDTTHALDVG